MPPVAKGKSKRSKLFGLLGHTIKLTILDGRSIKGKFLSYDRHLNVVIADAVEHRPVQLVKNKKGDKKSEEAAKEETRDLGLLLLRGDSVSSMIVIKTKEPAAPAPASFVPPPMMGMPGMAGMPPGVLPPLHGMAGMPPMPGMPGMPGMPPMPMPGMPGLAGLPPPPPGMFPPGMPPPGMMPQGAPPPPGMPPPRPQ